MWRNDSAKIQFSVHSGKPWREKEIPDAHRVNIGVPVVMKQD